MGKPTHGWLRSSLQKNKITGKQQVEVLSLCVPASKNDTSMDTELAAFQTPGIHGQQIRAG